MSWLEKIKNNIEETVKNVPKNNDFLIKIENILEKITEKNKKTFVVFNLKLYFRLLFVKELIY